MKIRCIIYILFSIILLQTGCANKQELPNILRLRLKEDPTTLDPAYIVDVAGGSVSAKLYSGLVKFDEHYNIVPDIAESWEISPDKLKYTFKLRSDSNVTADKVKESFERIISPETLSPRSWIFDKVSEFKAVDKYTFQVVLKEPFAPFLSLLTMPNAYIKDTGPYRLVEWEHDQKIVLEPNPLYFGDKPKVDGIEYKVIPEEFTAKAEFEVGNLDVIEVQPMDWIRFSKRGTPTYSQVGLNTYYIGFNCQRSPFNSAKVRQAFNYAIDKESIIKHLLENQADISSGPVPSILLKNKNIPYSYLPNRAKKMLEDIKFSKPLKLYVRAESQAIQIAEAIQHYLKEAGIETEILPLEWSAFKEAVATGEPSLFLMSWWADYPDPENFLFPTFHSSNWGAGGNRVRFSNPIIDNLIEKAQKDSSHEIYEKLQRLINRQAPWIFLWHKKELFAANTRVYNFKMYPVYNSDKGTDVYLHN